MDAQHSAIARWSYKAPCIERYSTSHQPLGVCESDLHPVNASNARNVAIQTFKAPNIGCIALAPARSACPRVNKEF